MDKNIHPAQLWVASQSKLVVEVKHYLRSIFCNKNCGNSCVICKQIENNQHHSIYWAQPENQYTVDDIHIIIKKLSYKLDLQEKFFIILNNADCLTPLCANSLLKSLEEPPAGYHFILLAQNKEAILPTVLSRCLIKILEDNFNLKENPLSIFMIENLETFNGAKLLKLLEDNKIHERDCQPQVDILISNFKDKYQDAINNNNLKLAQNYLNIVQTLTNVTKKLPMPGSSKIFWKNLYLKLNSLKH